MNQTSRAVLTRHRVASVTHLRIAGAIDETFSVQEAGADLVGHVIIDLGRLERISSFGVRKWIEFVGKLPAGAMGLYVIHAPPIVVDQLNMVEGFAGVAKILSLLAPYRCEKCNEDRVCLVDVHKERDTLAEGKAPVHACPVCAEALQFADIPGEFFDFVRMGQSQSAVESVVTRYVESLQPTEAPEPMAVSKIIEGDVTFFRMTGIIAGDLNVRRLSAGLEGRVVFDFAGVRTVEPKAEARLMQVLQSVAQNAKLFVSRVSPPVLSMLARVGQLPPGVLTSVSVPAQCRNCGGRYNNRVDGPDYVRMVAAGGPHIDVCQICGGQAQLAHLPDVIAVAKGLQPGAAPPEVELLEHRAFSQYLSTPSPDVTPSRQTESGGNTGGHRLQILKRLGRGGMAEVFLARQQGVKGFEKYVVLKKILGQYAQSPDFVEMLFAEARANARLTHPNIVQTFDVGMMDGFAYITMEYVRGPDVKRALVELRKKKIKLPAEHALRIVAETAAGLHYAHSYVDPTGKPHPMVHRDVSPHNVLLSLDGAIKLSDFGIAKVQGESDQTQAGVLKGKIAYVSPEAVSGMPLDARNDVFALGVVLYELLTGTIPFKRENDAATLRAIVREPAQHPSQLDPSIPQDVGTIVLWALEKDPARRVQTAAQLREAIEQVMARHGMSSSPSAVADFFKNNLARELVEYGPIQTTDPGVVLPPMQPAAPADRSSSISLVEVAPAGLGAGAGASGAAQGGSAAAGGLSRPGADEGPTGAVKMPGAVASPSHNDAELGPGKRATRPHAAVGPGAEGTGTGRTAVSPPPVAPLVHSAPSAPAVAQARASVSGSVSARGGNAAVATAVAPAPVPPQAEPTTEPRTELQVAQAAPPSPARSGLMTKLGAVGIVLAGLAVGGVMLLRDGGGVAVRNLGTGENLYVDGVRVSPGQIHTEAPHLFVAVGKDGKLLRFGTASSKDGIDARALVSADAAGTTGRKTEATVQVRSEPAGCIVRFGDTTHPEATPVRATVPAGEELEVSVNCPGQAPWTRHVLAIPRQQIELSATFTP